MAKIISYICILLIATMAGPMIVNPPSALANIAMLQCNLRMSIGASSELVLQLSTNSDDVANFNTMFVCITEPYMSVSNKIKLPYVPTSFISYALQNLLPRAMAATPWASHSGSSSPVSGSPRQLGFLSILWLFQAPYD